jgi:hypothetical protein
VQSSSLLAVRLHRLNFYVVPWKLIPKLQTFSECIQETPMVRSRRLFLPKKPLRPSCELPLVADVLSSIAHFDATPELPSLFTFAKLKPGQSWSC